MPRIFTADELRDAVDDERAKGFFVFLLTAIGCSALGFAAGFYSALHLPGWGS